MRLLSSDAVRFFFLFEVDDRPLLLIGLNVRTSTCGLRTTGRRTQLRCCCRTISMDISNRV